MTVTENVVHLYARVDDGVEQFLFRPRTLAGEDRVRAYRDALSGCVYDGDQKAFVTTPSLSYAVVTRLRSAGFEVLPKGPAEAKFQRVSAEHWADLQALKDRIAYFDSELGKRRHPTSGKRLRLLDYQKAGVEWLSSRTRALLADDQGLGKSCQVLTAAPADAPILVASPKTVKLAWVREVAIWRPGLRVHAVAKKEDFRFPRAGELVVANFELLPSLHVGGCEREEVYECDGCSPLLVDGAPGHLPDCRVGEKKGCDGCAPLVRDLQRGTILVVDELHFAKSRKTRRHDVVRTLARACLQRGGRAWGATGTPLVNRYEELWNVLEVLDCAREAYGSFWKFAELHGGKPKLVEKHVRGVGRKTVQKGWTWGDVQPGAAERLRRVALRRLKKDVLRELPPKTHRFIPVEISAEVRNQCDATLRDLGSLEQFLELKKIPFELVSKVRAALAEAKIPAMLALVEQAEHADDPLLVFSAHRGPIEELRGRPGWGVIMGGLSDKERTRVVNEFQDGKLLGVGITCQAGGTGLTLTRSAHEIFVDRPWTVAEMVQCEDRAHRHGQTRGLLIEILVADHPLDERVNEILLAKALMTEQSVNAAAITYDMEGQ